MVMTGAAINKEVANVTPILLMAKLKVMTPVDQSKPLKMTNGVEKLETPLPVKRKLTIRMKMNPKRNLPNDNKIGLIFSTTTLENIFEAARKMVLKIIKISPVFISVRAIFPTETKYIAKIIITNNTQNDLDSLSLRNKKANMAVSEVVII